VRYYTTKTLNGRTLFRCTFCEHTVTTQEFQSKNGNRRTQAATAINQHAAAAHSRPTPFSAYGVQWHSTVR
jgi:hypothetical protein